METDSSPSCETCGVRLRTDSPSGVCPRCLFEQAMAPTELGEGSSSYEVPTVAQIQDAFPDLEIIELVGRGGMGAVFKARQPQLDRLVAVKILPQELADRSGFRERFEREAKALAALDHSHIITIHDFGQSDAESSAGYYFLLMEFVDGINLRDLLHSRQLTPEEGLAIVPPICDALEFAHARGIVHRDIKPENLLLDKDGRVKIADFVITKILSSDHEERGGDESPQGTPRYMAPEQRDESEKDDHRVDIYALGVVIYELLTGEAPTQSLQSVAKRAGVDVRIDAVVRRALDKDPALRFQTVTELKTQLHSIQETLPTDSNSLRSPATAIACLAIGGMVMGLLVYVLVSWEAIVDGNQEISEMLRWFRVWLPTVLIPLSFLLLLFGSAMAWQHFEWLRGRPRDQRKHVWKTSVAVLVVPTAVAVGLASSQGQSAVILVVLGGVCAVRWLVIRLRERSTSSMDFEFSAALHSYRWAAWVLLIVGGAVVTPTQDIPTLTLLVAPLIALYELILWLTGKFNRHGKPIEPTSVFAEATERP